MAKLDLKSGPKTTPNKMIELAQAIGYPVVHTATKEFLDCDANVPAIASRVLENIIEMKDTAMEKAIKSIAWLQSNGEPDKREWAARRINELHAEQRKWDGQRQLLVDIVGELEDRSIDMSAFAEADMNR